ncbi:putative methylglutaconyl-CoA hydratase (mitochondrion) [Lupinus albus]|uniref:Putative methylglutaconyl-CoA hydratase n=1 Tax=Lupinus albus TaxID=3870 RepID=A0A6A4MI04_LUPAL|nr:putative methylglutaconyl-CoA hydratase [Lupinus albus]
MCALRVLTRFITHCTSNLKSCSKPYYFNHPLLFLNLTTDTVYQQQYQSRRNLILEPSASEFVKLHNLQGSDSVCLMTKMSHVQILSKLLISDCRIILHTFTCRSLLHSVAIFSVLLPYLENEKLNSYTNVAIISSSVPGVFCAGADLKERRTMNESEVKDFVNSLRSTFSFLEAVRVPTIAVIEGVALGGGLEMALACDIRICGEDALMGLPETGLAIIPGNGHGFHLSWNPVVYRAGGTQRLPRLVGHSIAKDIIYTGRKINGTEALSIGMLISEKVIKRRDVGASVEHVVYACCFCLVNYCVAAGEAYSKALAMARDINQKGPVAIKMAKRAINEGVETDLTSALALEEDCYDQVLITKDRLEGLAAFAEKRKPRYTGK